MTQPLDDTTRITAFDQAVDIAYRQVGPEPDREHRFHSAWKAAMKRAIETNIPKVVQAQTEQLRLNRENRLAMEREDMLTEAAVGRLRASGPMTADQLAAQLWREPPFYMESRLGDALTRRPDLFAQANGLWTLTTTGAAA